MAAAGPFTQVGAPFSSSEAGLVAVAGTEGAEAGRDGVEEEDAEAMEGRGGRRRQGEKVETKGGEGEKEEEEVEVKVGESAGSCVQSGEEWQQVHSGRANPSQW